MYWEGKLKLKSHNTSYCLIEVVTKVGLTVFHSICVFLSFWCYRSIRSCEVFLLFHTWSRCHHFI